ncbi:hypothetical protein Q361_11721 [Flavobacterium croceum DSM 17960]|uniref:Uncharacterized protein n=1 Tax=Flavobacterium croceum DSM 17960 TaxID=1121886 RepID=A0A2S4N5B2_9FLAO|nr:hypothetical protein [Flavobacterium croceum]POS00918.1 hypothetical protein Q361_11721 [Flavobacterium croceum DSM 17960]
MVAIKLNEIIPKIIKHCDFEKYLTKNGYVKTQRNLPDGAIAFYEKNMGFVNDTILLSNIEGKTTYYSMSFKDKGDIINFVTNRIELLEPYFFFDADKDNLIEACKKLIAFISEQDSDIPDTALSQSITQQQFKNIVKNAFTAYYNAKDDIFSYEVFDYFNISAETIQDAVFVNKIFSTVGLKINQKLYNSVNISFPIYDIDDNECGLHSINVIEFEEGNQKIIDFFVPGADKTGIWHSEAPEQFVNATTKVTIVNSPIEALAHSDYCGDKRYYISIYDINQSTIEIIKKKLKQFNYYNIYLSLSIENINFDKEIKLLSYLLDINIKFNHNYNNTFSIVIDKAHEKEYLDMIKEIKNINNDIIQYSLNALGRSSNTYLENLIITVSTDASDNLLINVPKNYKTFYKIETALCKIFNKKTTIIIEKPKYMNWVNQNKFGNRIANFTELVEKNEILIYN